MNIDTLLPDFPPLDLVADAGPEVGAAVTEDNEPFKGYVEQRAAIVCVGEDPEPFDADASHYAAWTAQNGWRDIRNATRTESGFVTRMAYAPGHGLVLVKASGPLHNEAAILEVWNKAKLRTSEPVCYDPVSNVIAHKWLHGVINPVLNVAEVARLMAPYWATGACHGDLSPSNIIRVGISTFPVDPNGHADSPAEDIANWLVETRSPAYVLASLPTSLNRDAVVSAARNLAELHAQEHPAWIASRRTRPQALLDWASTLAA